MARVRPPYEEWNEDFGCEDVVDGLIAYAKQIKPDAILTLGTFVYWQDDRIEAVPVGFGEVVRELNAEGIDVIGFRDNPRFQTDPSTCALTEGSEAVECSVSRDLIYALESPLTELRQLDGFYEIDLADQFCPDGRCLPQIGNVLVYFDRHHVTQTYMSTLSFFVEEQLAEQGFVFRQ